MFELKYLSSEKQGESKLLITAENGESIEIIQTLKGNSLVTSYESKSIVNTKIQTR